MTGLPVPSPPRRPQSSPVDPRTLVSLPDVGAAAARGVTTTSGAAEIAALAAKAFGAADSGVIRTWHHRKLTTLILTLQRSEGVSPKRYREELQQYWLDRAAARAGIDLHAWNPSLGSDAPANRRAIEAVYTYYGKLFLEHPELRWAGMANMIGPSFAAGFFDLDAIRGFARAMADVYEKVPPTGRPPHLAANDLAALANARPPVAARFRRGGGRTGGWVSQ